MAMCFVTRDIIFGEKIKYVFKKWNLCTYLVCGLLPSACFFRTRCSYLLCLLRTRCSFSTVFANYLEQARKFYGLSVIFKV